MFFHALLLEPQHKMQLSLPWIAATLGVKKIKKEDIINCSVSKVCNHILIFVKSDSLNPNKRFSLRLSAILISGVCQILRQQVFLLQAEINRSLLVREKIADRLLEEFHYEDESPKPTVKKKKTKQPHVDTPESLIGRIEVVPRGRKETDAEPEFTLGPLHIPEVIAEEPILQARTDEITLREEVAIPEEPQLRDDFGPFEEFPVPLPSISAAQEIIAEVSKSPKEKEKRDESRIEEEMVPPAAVALEDVLREERVQPEVPQVRFEEVQEMEGVPPPDKEPVIQVVPQIEVIPAQQPEKEAAKEVAAKEDMIVEKTKASDLTQLKMVEPTVEPKVFKKIQDEANAHEDKIMNMFGRMNITLTGDAGPSGDFVVNGQSAYTFPIQSGTIECVKINPPPKQSAPSKKGERNIAASLLLKKKKRRFVFINQEKQIYREEPEFTFITNIIPDFKPMIKFWPGWETIQMEVEAVRPPRDTVSTRVSAVTEGSLGLRVDKTAETPEALLAVSIPIPSEVASSGPRYLSTPRKRPQLSEETVEEVLPPAANGEMRTPEIQPRKKKKVVSIEDVQAAELPFKEGVPEEHLIPLEISEIQKLTVSEVRQFLLPPVPEEHRRIEEAPSFGVEEATKESLDEVRSPLIRASIEKEADVTPPRYKEVNKKDHPPGDFGVKWSRRIMLVVYQHDKIGPIEICEAINKKLTKLNMSILFAALLALAKDRYVLLHSAEDSCELKYVERGPKEIDF